MEKKLSEIKKSEPKQKKSSLVVAGLTAATLAANTLVGCVNPTAPEQDQYKPLMPFNDGIEHVTPTQNKQSVQQTEDYGVYMGEVYVRLESWDDGSMTDFGWIKMYSPDGLWGYGIEEHITLVYPNGEVKKVLGYSNFENACGMTGTVIIDGIRHSMRTGECRQASSSIKESTRIIPTMDDGF